MWCPMVSNNIMYMFFLGRMPVAHVCYSAVHPVPCSAMPAVNGLMMSFQGLFRKHDKGGRTTHMRNLGG